MRPRFSVLTRALGAVHFLAGIQAGVAELTIRASAFQQIWLLVLAVGYLIVGLGIWGEFVWAWWTGVALAGVVVVMRPTGLSLIWLAVLVGFAVSGVQGWRDGARKR